MGQAAYLVGRLKKVLKDRSVTYKDLAERLAVSESGLKRAFAQSRFSLERLEEICDIAGIEFKDLMALDEKNAPTGVLNHDQEAALAASPKLFGFFYLLSSELPLAVIEAKFAFTPQETRKYLLQLDKLGIIHCLPGDRYRLRVRRDIWWNERGPLRALYDDAIKKDFISSPFAADQEDLLITFGRLAPSSLRLVSRKMMHLLSEIRELMALDGELPHQETVNVTFLAAYRPWVLPLLRSLRRARTRD